MFWQYILKVLQLLLCSIVIQNLQIFYWDPVMFIVTCYLAKPDCRNFLPEYCNNIIKQQLCGEESPSLLPLLQVDVFQKNQCILQQIKLCSSSKTTKKLVSGLVMQIIPLKVFTNVPPYCNRKSILSMWCKNWLDTHLSRSVLSIWLYSFFHLSAMKDRRIINFFYFFPIKFHIIK